MKKTKLALFVLSTVGLAAGLASCDKKEESSQSSSETSTSSTTCVVDETKRGTIKVSEEMPTEIAVGETVNLDDFVTVTGVDCWVVELSEGENFVTLTGHVLTGVDCGHFKILLTAGRTKKAVEMDVISEAKAEINELLAVTTNNYTAELYRNGAYDGVKGVHNANYWWIDIKGEGQEGLALLSDGGWYAFNYDGNAAQSVTFPAGGADPTGPYYYLCMDFPLKGDQFEDKKDENGEVIYDDSGLTTIQLKDGIDLTNSEVYLAVKALGIDPSKFGTTCWAEIDTANSGEKTLWLHGQKKTTMRGGTETIKDTGYSIKITAINKTHINGVDDYIEAGNIPEAIEATEVKAAVGAMEASKLYRFDSYFTVLDGTGKAEITESQAAGYQIFADANLEQVWDFFHGDTTAFVNGQSYYSVDNNDGYVVSYVNHDGKMHRVVGEKGEDNLMHYEATDYSKSFTGDNAYEDITLYTQDGAAVAHNLTVSKLTDELVDSADFYSKSTAETGEIVYGVTGSGEDNGAFIEDIIRMAPQKSLIADYMGFVDYEDPTHVTEQDGTVILGTDGSITLTMRQGYRTADNAKIFYFYAGVSITPTATDMVPTDYLDEVVWPTVTE